MSDGSGWSRREFLQAGAGLMVVATGFESTAAPPSSGPALGPTLGQRAMIARGYGMFLHFGINTFNQTEWSDGTLPPSSYHPTHLDPDQWIATAKEAGFRHVILITKHHDGFCMWPTKRTDYSVASSPVKTDVVGAVAEACKRHGVQLGLYYSLWDRHEPTHKEKDPAHYIAFMKGQLTELLTNYGPVCELWFDGAWAKPDAAWDIPGVRALIAKLQPDCMVGVNHTIAIPGKPRSICQPTDYKAGYPIRFWPTDFRLKDPNLARWDDPKLYADPAGEMRYLPFEHTICLSDRWNWFQKRDVMPARSVDELEALFHWCTANDNALIINVPPDQTGRLRENERQAILALADRLGIRGGAKPLPMSPRNQAFGCPVTASSTWHDDPTFGPDRVVDTSLETRWAAGANVAELTLKPARPFKFDQLVIHEYADTHDLGDGFSQQRAFRVQGYTIDALNSGAWQSINHGDTIGAAKIIRLDRTHAAEQLRLRITRASVAPSLCHIAVSDTSETAGRSRPEPA